MLPSSWKKEVQDSVADATHIENEKNKAVQAEQAAAVTAALASINRQFENHNERQERAEGPKRWSDILTIAFVFATAVFTGLSWWVFYGQLGEMKATGEQTNKLIEANITLADTAKKSVEIGEKALVAANRPWIKIDLQVAGPIIYNVNGANIKLKYGLRNIGHSPATNVWIDTNIFASAIGIDNVIEPRAELQKIIAMLKTRPRSPFGLALFPDETVAQDITVNIGTDELKRITQKVEFIMPYIIGAADYRFGIDEKSHQTGFIIEVRRSDQPRPESTEKNRHPAAIFPDEGDIPASEIRIFRSALDGEYVD
jgi:hypothetical protein